MSRTGTKDRSLPPANSLDRRGFLLSLAAMFAATEKGAAKETAADLPRASAAPAFQKRPALKPLVGIQMGPHTMLDEGIDHVLDLIRESAAVDTVMVYSHTYHSNMRKPLSWLAPDHGRSPRLVEDRRLPSVWVRPQEQHYKNTVLRHQRVGREFEYVDRDLLAEMIEPARKRGMRVFARILEGSGALPAERIGNFARAVTVDVDGRPTRVGCWNNPDYREFWAATAADLFSTYDLDGFQWGAERMGPLMNVVMPWNDDPPACFCPHCLARGKAQGIDGERARKGYEQLYLFVRSLRSEQARPAEGVFTVFLRQLLRYPEILSWEYMYRQSREDVMRAMYGAIKRIQPSAEVGWHVDHQPSSWDIVYRAEMSYEEMAPYSDFIKFIAYHDVLGPRIRWWYLERLKLSVLAEIPLDRSLDLYYDLFGYDRAKEPKVEELEKKGFSPDYVYRETLRSVASAAGRTKIYPGIGFDVPWGDDHLPADPEEVRVAVLKAFAAGADGIVVSREYEEMRLANLKAVGRAVREVLARPMEGS